MTNHHQQLRQRKRHHPQQQLHQHKLQTIFIFISFIILQSKSQPHGTHDKTSKSNQQKDVLTHILHNLSTVPSEPSSSASSASSASSSTATWMYDEDATILDVFGQVAKEVLTNRMVSLE